jgi:hypothetical protein
MNLDNLSSYLLDNTLAFFLVGEKTAKTQYDQRSSTNQN